MCCLQGRCRSCATLNKQIVCVCYFAPLALAAQHDMMDDGAINCKHTVLARAQTHTHTHMQTMMTSISVCVRNSLGISSRRPASTLNVPVQKPLRLLPFPRPPHIITCSSSFLYFFICHVYSSVRHLLEAVKALQERLTDACCVINGHPSSQSRYSVNLLTPWQHHTVTLTVYIIQTIKESDKIHRN